MDKQQLYGFIDKNAQKFISISDRIWDYGETAFAEYKPATIQYAETYTENLNFVRRYYRSDGTPTGDNYGSFSDAPGTGEVIADLYVEMLTTRHGK